jgi:hypothetical protein
MYIRSLGYSYDCCDRVRELRCGHAKYVSSKDRHRDPYLPLNGRDGCSTQAQSWLEWGSSTIGQSLASALSCFRVVYSESISSVPHSLSHRGPASNIPTRFDSAEIRLQPRSDRGPSPWSMPPRSLSRTSPWSPCTHRLPRGHAAASANRRSGRHGCRST